MLVTLTVVPVCVVAFTLAPPNTLPPVMLPVTETVAPVCVVALTLAPPNTLPPLMLPVTTKLVNVPTEVILPCAAVVTVPAVVADVADGTVPVTLAPGIDVSPAPDPLNCDPVTVLVTLTVVPVCVVAFTLAPPSTLPPLMFPVTAKLVNVPTEVILVCAAVDNVPAIPVTLRLPPVMLPVTETVAPVCVVALTLAPPNTLPPVMLPVTDIVVPVRLTALTVPPPFTLAPVMLPDVDNTPEVHKLPPVMLALTLTVVPVCVVALTLAPPNTLPPVMLPVTETVVPV